LAILELETKKNEIIRDQQYEKVADIRQEQRVLADELDAIENELAALSIQPKPSQKAMNLYIHSLKIEKCLNANKDSFLSAIDTIKGKLEEINEQKKELTLESDKALRRRVFQDNVNWTNVLERYTIK
jgi:predicted  nucleic acid-binding Zn-ribbon protein